MVRLLILFLTFTTHFPTKTQADFVAVTPSSRIVYVLWRQTLFRSDDGGVTFTPRINDDPVANLIVDPVNPDILYHWDREDIRRSTDGGTSWRSAAFPSPRPPSISKLIVDPQHPARLWLSSRCNESGTGGIYRSDDRGDHWTQVASGECVADIALDPVTGELYTYTGVLDARIIPSHQVVVDPRTPQVRYGIGFDVQVPQGPLRVVVVTIDGGRNWQRMPVAGVDGSIGNLALDPIDGRLFLATSTGVFVRASDGWSWSRIAGTPPGGEVYADSASLYVLSGGKLFHAPLATLDAFDVRGAVTPIPVTGFAYDAKAHALYASGPGVWRSRDSGRNWELITAEDGVRRGAIAVDAAGEVYVIASRSPNEAADVLRYAAGTGEWNSAGQVPYADFPILVAHPTRRGVLFATADSWRNRGAGLFTTDDAGDHWRPVAPFNSHVLGIAIHPARPDVIDVSTENGVFISRDAGVQWTRTTLGGPSWIAVAPSDPSRLYAQSLGLLRSDDGGMTWQSLALPDGGTQTLAVDPLDADSLWGIGDTVVHSTNGGRTWRTEESNFPPAHYPDLLFFEPDGAHMHVALSPATNDPLGSCEFDATLRSVDDGSDGHHRAAHH